PNVPGGRYPDRQGRDEAGCLPESGSARFKPLLLILSGPGSRASRNGRECPVRNHTSGRESIGDDECAHSLPRRGGLVIMKHVLTVMLIATACVVGSAPSFARGGVVHLLARGGVEHGLGDGWSEIPCAKSHIGQRIDRR